MSTIRLKNIVPELDVIETWNNTNSDNGIFIKRFQTVDGVSDSVVSDTAAETGVSQTGSLTSITLAAGANAVDDYYNGWWLHITSGTGSGQIRRIKDYNGTTKVADIYSNADNSPEGADFATSPDATSNYSLFNRTYINSFYDESVNQWKIGYSSETNSNIITQDLANLTVNDFTVLGAFSNGGLTSEGQFIVDHTDTEAVIVRKDGDSGDIFTIDTTNGKITLNNTLSFTDSGAPLIDMKSSGFGPPTFTTRSAGTKLVLYEQISASFGDYAIGVGAESDLWYSVPGTASNYNFNWFAGTTNIMRLRADGALMLNTTTGTAGALTLGYNTGNSQIAFKRDDGNINGHIYFDADRNLVMENTSGSRDVTLKTNSAGKVNIETKAVIDFTSTEAFLVRKDSDGGDIFVVDTTNTRVGIGKAPSVTLDVEGTTRIRDTLVLYQPTGGGDGGQIVLGFPGADITAESTSSWNIDVDSSNNLRFFVSGSDIALSFASATGKATFDGCASVDCTDTEAFLVRKNADGGDVFTVDTTNSKIHFADTNFYANYNGTDPYMYFDGNDYFQYDRSANEYKYIISSSEKLSISDTVTTSNNTVTIDNTSIEALLVRKDSDGGDIFIVDTTNSVVTVNSGRLRLSGSISGPPLFDGAYLTSLAGTYTDDTTAASGTTSSMIFNSFSAPTLAATNTSVTTTDAATLYISGAPAEGTNQTITNSYALWVNSGDVRLDGDITINNTLNFTDSGIPLIHMASTSVNPPSFTTRSNGSKIVLFEKVDATNVDYGIGIESFFLWNSVPQGTSSYGFKWYGGTTERMRLRGDGALILNTTTGTAGALTLGYNTGNSQIAFKRADGNINGHIYFDTIGHLVMENTTGAGSLILKTDIGGKLDIQTKVLIDDTDTEAFLVRKDADAGDVFVVDTTNSKVGVNVVPTTAGALAIGYNSGGYQLELERADTAVGAYLRMLADNTVELVAASGGATLDLKSAGPVDITTTGVNAFTATQFGVTIGTRATTIGQAYTSSPSTTAIYMRTTSATWTDDGTAASGTAAQDFIGALIQRPTLAATNTAVTTTTATSFKIAGPPIAGTNQTVTNSYALWVDSGNTLLDGDLTVLGSLVADSVTYETLVVDSTSTEALLVRKDSDTGDVFVVDTTNSIVKVPNGSALTINTASHTDNALRIGYNSGIPTVLFERPDGQALVDMYVDSSQVFRIRNLDGSNPHVDLILSDGGVNYGKVGVYDGRLELGANDHNIRPGTNGVLLRSIGNTFTDYITSASGTAALTTFNAFEQPTLAATNTTVTTTDTATVYIEGAPVAGTNQTLTNSYALWVDSGDVQFDGNLNVSGSLVADSVTYETLVVDSTNIEALLVRKNSDSGDVFTVDTTNSIVKVQGTGESTSSITGALTVDGGVGVAKRLNVGGVIQADYQGDGVRALNFVRSDGSAAQTGISLIGTSTGTRMRLDSLSGGKGRVDIGDYFFFNVDGTITTSKYTIEKTDTEAFLVRKDSDGGDIFTIDTTNSITTVKTHLVIDGNQNYEFDGESGAGIFTNHLSIQSQTAATNSLIGLYTKDSDGTDDNILSIFSSGAPSASSNYSRMVIGYDQSEASYLLVTDVDGTGTNYPITIETSGNSSQLKVNTDGSVSLGDNTASTGVGTGTLQVTGGAYFGNSVYFDSNTIIDKTNTEAFLVRKDSDSGDVFRINTTDDVIFMESRVSIFGNKSGTPGDAGTYLRINNGTNTFTDNNTAASGTAAIMAFNSFGAPTLAASNSSVTTTDAATVYIKGAPIAGTNQTITNSYALWVDSGNVQFDGDLTISGSLVADSVTYETVIVDSTNTEAFLVRKNSDGGDVFTVDTTNDKVTINNELTFTDAGASLINMRNGAAGAPTFTTRSAGTKIVLNDSVDATNVDYAMGIDAFTFWSSIRQATSLYMFKWYGGTTERMRLRGDGALMLNTTTGQAGCLNLGYNGGSAQQIYLQNSGGANVGYMRMDANSDLIWGNGGAADNIKIYANAGSIIQYSKSVVEKTDAEAFLVRKDADAGDVFTVDTVNNRANVFSRNAVGAFSVREVDSNITNIIPVLELQRDPSDASDALYGDGSASSIRCKTSIRLVNRTYKSGGPNEDDAIVFNASGTGEAFNMDLNYGYVNILDATESTSTISGALVVDGGLGIAKKLNIGGVTQIEYQGDGTRALQFKRSDGVVNTGISLSGTTSNTKMRLESLSGGKGMVNIYNGSTDYVQFHSDGSIMQSKFLIEKTNTEALLVRKDADGGDVFTVDTTNSKVLINGIDVTPSTGIIAPTTFSAANNVTSPANVTGFAFSEASVRSFKALVTIVIDATVNLYAQFELRGLQKATGVWVITENEIGDTSNVSFSMVSDSGNGQIRYTSGNESGFVSSTFTFSTTEVHNI